MLRRACLETPRNGPMRRASAPPKAEAQSSGKNLNPLNRDAAPQASRRRERGRASMGGATGRTVFVAADRHRRGPSVADMGHAAAARAELTAACSRFTEGFGTADYRNARAILDGVNPAVARR